jgi:hypothetical protein
MLLGVICDIHRLMCRLVVMLDLGLSAVREAVLSTDRW